jgi:acyl-CoA dehydrogenase
MAAAMEAYGRVCLEEAVVWARERKTFGQRLADHQVIRHKIAQMKQQLKCDSSLYSVLLRID